MEVTVTQVTRGNQRFRALSTVGPWWCTRIGNALAVSPNARYDVAIILEPDTRLVRMGWLSRHLLPDVPGMFGPDGILRWNPDAAYLTAETVVHELVHVHQRSVMGPMSYDATFVLAIPGALLMAFRHGGTWHDWHPMERQARRASRAIIDAWSPTTVDGVLDAPLKIREYFA